MDPVLAGFILVLIAPIYLGIYGICKFIAEKYNTIEDVTMRVINVTIAKISYNTYELIALVNEYNAMRKKLIELGVNETAWPILTYNSPTDKIVVQHRAISREYVSAKIRAVMGGLFSYTPDIAVGLGRFLGLPEHVTGGIIIHLLKFIG